MIWGNPARVILVCISFCVYSNLAHAQDSVQVNKDLQLPQDKSDSTKVDSTNSTPDLEKFRDAFQKVIEQQKQQRRDSAATKQKNIQQDPVLDLGGLVLDETRSKMGRDFYSLFYQKWQAPEDLSNFTITINERPSPGRGTQVTIKIDYEQVYAARLQPRYEYIEAVSQQAVAQCLKIIKQKAEVRNQLSGI